jgi:glutaredoxin-like protein
MRRPQRKEIGLVFENREGQRIPEVTFKTREGGDWKDLSSAELFGGRTVVLFALPGAFTPTCSSSHLPRYEELAPVFREAGVDEIACLSVNDGFVMEAWGREQGAKTVRLVADGNGDFTRAMGMLVDKRDLGFGQRSWRYSMIVRDGIIEKMFIEPDKPGDPYEVSDADTMLRHVAPNAKPRRFATLFTRAGCGHCARAKKALEESGYGFEEIVVGRDASSRALEVVTGATTVPQVFIEGRRIGGADDLARYLAKAA